MEQILIDKLRMYVVENNPDLMLRLQQSFEFNRYLLDKVATVLPLMDQLFEEGKPQYIIEELCLKEMTADLRPSKTNFIRAVLQSEFMADFVRFRELGVLTYEVVNMAEACRPVFESFGFTEENEDDPKLLLAIAYTIRRYLDSPPKD